MISISKIWDRFWWSLMITILIGLVWLKFLDPIIPCVGIGLVIATGAGLVYFSIGLRDMVREKRLHDELEKKALEDA
jgi:hypothetical protein